MSFGFTEIILIALFILIIFGAKRIPELARALGRASSEFKKAKSSPPDADDQADKTETSDPEKIKKA